MTTLTYRGDAPAVAKQIFLGKPLNYVVGEIELKIGNKTITAPNWDTALLVSKWNNSGYPETAGITAAAVVSTGQYGVSANEGIMFTANVAGEDFFLTAFINNSTVTNEIQRINFNPVPSGGTFKLTFSGQQTGAITYVANDPVTTAANIQTALIALSNIGVGDVVVNGEGVSLFSVYFIGAFAGTDVPQMSIDFSSLLGGDAVLTVNTIQQGVLPYSEVQTLVLSSNPTGGTFTLSYAGQTTGNIAYNASSATVQTALRALSTIGSTGVTCSGGALPGTSIVITFGGTLANQNVPMISVDGSLLTGGTNNIAGPVILNNGTPGYTTNTVFAVFRTESHYDVGVGEVYNPFRWVTTDKDGVVHYSNWSTYPNRDISQLLIGMVIGYEVQPGYFVNYSIQSSDFELLSTSVTSTFTLELKGNFTGKNVLSNPCYVDDFNTVKLREPIHPGRINTQQYRLNSTSADMYEIISTPNISVPSIHSGSAYYYESQQYEILDVTKPGNYTLTIYSPSSVSYTLTIPFSVVDSIALSKLINSVFPYPYIRVTSSNNLGNYWSFILDWVNFNSQSTNIQPLSILTTYAQVVETVPGYSGVNEIQKLHYSSLSGKTPRGGSYTLNYDGQVTDAILYNSSASSVQNSLIALSNLSTNDIVVSGSLLSDMLLLFRPELGNVPEMLVVSTLTNAEATVATYVGGGLDISLNEYTRNKGPQCFDDANNYDPQQIPSTGDIVQFEFGQDHCKWGIKQRDTFTVVSTSTNMLQLSCKRPLFQVGQGLKVRTTSAAPGGLTAGTTYYVIFTDGYGQLQLSSSPGGSAIDITNTGTGVHTLELQLASFVAPARFTNEIGLPRTGLGFEEYRPRYLEAAIDSVTIGERDGSGSSLIRLNTGTVPSSVIIRNTGSSSETSIATVSLLANNASTDITCYGGTVGLAQCLDESSVVRDITLTATNFSSIGLTDCRNLYVDKSSSIRGNFTPDSLITGV